MVTRHDSVTKRTQYQVRISLPPMHMGSFFLATRHMSKIYKQQAIQQHMRSLPVLSFRDPSLTFRTIEEPITTQ